MYLSTNLSFLRKKSGMTQEEIANTIGLKRSTICLYENGNSEPSLEKIIKLAHYFSVSIDDLLLKDLRPQSPIFARNLKYLRGQKGINQNVMADVLKLTQSTIANWEAGKREPDMEMLVRLSEYFGVTLDQMIKRDLSKEVEEPC